MNDSIFEIFESGDVKVDFPEHPERKRKRPVYGENDELSPALLDSMKRLQRNLGGSSRQTSTLHAPVYVEPAGPMTFVDRGAALPDSYGLDRLVALVRDPEWVFTYWELNGDTLESLKSARGTSFVDSCAWVLRVYRVDEDAAVDMEIDPAAGGWYVQVGKPGRYVFEMALLSPEGEWVSLMVSSMLGAPYAGVSDRIDEHWRLSPEAEAELNHALREAYELQNNSSLGGSSGSGGFGGPRASRRPTSYGLAGLPSSGEFIGGSGQFAGIGSSGAVNVSSSGGVSSGGLPSSWSFPASSGQVPASGGSGGFGWVHTPAGIEPVLVRPQIYGDGPNWNAQNNLPPAPQGKTHQPHFKVKLPRVLYKLVIPKATWPRKFAKASA